jgi:hypothetical protein
MFSWNSLKKIDGGSHGALLDGPNNAAHSKPRLLAKGLYMLLHPTERHLSRFVQESSLAGC